MTKIKTVYIYIYTLDDRLIYSVAFGSSLESATHFIILFF